MESRSGEGKAEAGRPWGDCHRHWDKGMGVGPAVGEITWRGDKGMGWSKNSLDLGTDWIDKVRERKKSQPLQDSSLGVGPWTAILWSRIRKRNRGVGRNDTESEGLVG